MASGFEKYPNGGADVWDNGLAGQLLTLEFFPLVEDEEEDEIIFNTVFLIRRRRRL